MKISSLDNAPEMAPTKPRRTAHKMDCASFNEFLVDLRSGKTQDELSKQLRNVAEAVAKTGKKGSIELKIVIDPDKHIEENGIVLIRDTIKVTKPEPDRASTLFFVTTDGGMTRQDPRQYALDGLREVEGRGQDLKDATK